MGPLIGRRPRGRGHCLKISPHLRRSQSRWPRAEFAESSILSGVSPSVLAWVSSHTPLLLIPNLPQHPRARFFSFWEHAHARTVRCGGKGTGSGRQGLAWVSLKAGTSRSVTRHGGTTLCRSQGEAPSLRSGLTCSIFT